ncbi:DUF416 family protein [Hymenobacter sp. BT507]|uniref:DUF416 family protein n=1 Tax=Hymenobacter citatus TaxID=2763506 RepID=A0ABR7MFC2_9BACT|nr:DUF416 family protein [Hymenobacter citatus]MBC6609772.1 DUF416 family protein [Hymenobacter citatus]
MFQSLDRQQCALLAATVCEKLYPSYAWFTEIENWGDVTIYQASVELLYGAAATPSAFVSEAQQMLTAFEQVFPDLDDFESLAASFGFDASCALDSALNFLISGGKAHIQNCVQFAFDTLDMYVQEIEGLDPNRADLKEIIENNEYVVQERKRQQELLMLLDSIAVLTPEVVAQLRCRQLTDSPIIEIERLS